MQVGLGPGHIVLDGDPAPPPPKRAQPPIFGPYPLRPCINQDATWYGGRPLPRRLCVRWGPCCPSAKKGRSPPPNFRPMFIVSCRTRVSWLYACCQIQLCLVIIEFGLTIMRNPVTSLTLFVLKIDCSVFKVTVTVTSFKKL